MSKAILIRFHKPRDLRQLTPWRLSCSAEGSKRHFYPYCEASETFMGAAVKAAEKYAKEVMRYSGRVKVGMLPSGDYCAVLFK